MTRFSSTYTVKKAKKTQIWVGFANPEVLYQNTYIGYVFTSLVGEVGGIIGITLGASTLTLLESLFQHLHYF